MKVSPGKIMITGLIMGIVLRLWLWPSLVNSDVYVFSHLAQLMAKGHLKDVYHENGCHLSPDCLSSNLPPGSLYLFWFVSRVSHLLEMTPLPFFDFSSMTLLLQKLPGLVGDVFLGVLLYRFFRKEGELVGLAAFGAYFFNPAVIYLSSLWGQYDSLISFFAYAGLASLGQGLFIVGSFLFSLSLFIKYTFIILSPLILIISLRLGIKLGRFILMWLGLGLLLWFFAFPFGFNLIDFTKFYLENLWSSGRSLSANAINFWGIFYHPNKFISDQVNFGPLKAAELGMAIFILIYILVIFVWLKKKARTKVVIFPAAALITYSAFLFLPRMHERYLFPALLPLLVWAIESRLKLIFLAYLFTSLLFFLNLYLVFPVGFSFLGPLVRAYHSHVWYLPVIMGVGHLVIFLGLLWSFVSYQVKDRSV